MLLDEQKNRLRVGGDIQDSTQFKIKATGKAFKALIDGLYSNKIGSIVRELISNQWDAHQQAGKLDTPFTVLAPTFVEPFAVFQDYGIGMDHEFVMSLYSTLFDSTKDGSNEMIGAFGLGSKSPFSYTDSFTLIAIKSGKKNTYQIYLNQDGVPVVQQVDSGCTDEGSGVTVKIPVEDVDLYTWEKEITDFIKYLTPFPSNNLAELKEPEVLYSNNNWKIHNTNNEYQETAGHRWRSSHYSMPIYIRQGIVDYKLDTDSLIDPSKVRELVSSNTGLTLVVDVPIGSVDVTVSREGLSYTDKTKIYLDSLLDKLKDDITDTLTAKLDTVTEPWDWLLTCEGVNEFVNTKNIKKTFKYNNHEYDFISHFYIVNGHPSPTMWKDWNVDCKAKGNRFDEYKKEFKKDYRLEVVERLGRVNKHTNIKVTNSQGYLNTSFVRFIVKDEHRWKAKLWHNKDSLVNNTIVLIKSSGADVSLDDAVKAFEKDFKGAPITWMSKLTNEIPKPVKGQRKNYGTTPLYNCSESDWWDVVSNDSVNDLLASTDKKLYVKSNRFNVELMEDSYGKTTFIWLVRELKKLDLLSSRQIYAVPKSNVKLIDDFDSNWVHLEDVLMKSKSIITKKLYDAHKRDKLCSFSVSDIDNRYKTLSNITEKITHHKVVRFLEAANHDVCLKDILDKKSIKFLAGMHKLFSLRANDNINNSYTSPCFSKLLDIDEDYLNKQTEKIATKLTERIKKIQTELDKAIDTYPILVIGEAWWSADYYRSRNFSRPGSNTKVSESDQEILGFLAKEFHATKKRNEA